MTMLSTSLAKIGQEKGDIEVTLANDLIPLLSEQLYQSPLKAIEELVVNAYDADATECRIVLPVSGDISDDYVVVFDDGIGMDDDGLQVLWRVGQSKKRTEAYQKATHRSQIGKFGIGKLATYAIANVITYLTRHNQNITCVSVDFREFSSLGKPTQTIVKRKLTGFPNLEKLSKDAGFIDLCNDVGLLPNELLNEEKPCWTFCILENLKEKAKNLHLGRLRWVLRTAMPLGVDFRIFLNEEQISSAKETYKKVVEFDITNIISSRIERLEKHTGTTWKVEDKSLRSDILKRGITGHVVVTERALDTGKSADLGRSNGFFIRVRGRLVNEKDALFGLEPLAFQTFNRFYASLVIDDLDGVLTASREGFEESQVVEHVRFALKEIFNEARVRHERYLAEISKPDERAKEHERDYVNPRLVEYPVADVISIYGASKQGVDADEKWFYLEYDEETDLSEIASALYTEKRSKYSYQYESLGKTGRMVKFNPEDATFIVNEDHDFIRAHFDDARARLLLEEIVTAESLLEIYMREAGISPYIIGDILERRDLLLRSIAQDQFYSLPAISSFLRDSRSSDHDLEIGLVAAVRSLGFVAAQIGGPGKPDGVARFTTYQDGEKKITIEAKSSDKVPSLHAIDFAGLAEHVEKTEAHGCLLLAPDYPGGSKQDAAAANRAETLKISCWTIDDLARVVTATESRQINARHVLDIVLHKFKPVDVCEAVEVLLSQPAYDIQALYEVILKALRDLHDRLEGSVRTVDHIAAEVSRVEAYKDINQDAVSDALEALARASRGALQLRDNRLIVLTSLEELERRVVGLTGNRGQPRRRGSFRGDTNSHNEE